MNQVAFLGRLRHESNDKKHSEQKKIRVRVKRLTLNPVHCNMNWLFAMWVLWVVLVTPYMTLIVVFVHLLIAIVLNTCLRFRQDTSWYVWRGWPGPRPSRSAPRCAALPSPPPRPSPPQLNRNLWATLVSNGQRTLWASWVVSALKKIQNS